MQVIVIEAPAPVLELGAVKTHLRVDGVADDVLIAGYIAAAQGWIDGPGCWLGRSLGEQELELRVDQFCGTMALPYGPIIEIGSVGYVDEAGAEQTVPDVVYELIGNDVVPVPGASWPAAASRREAVRIRYMAGYRDGVPPTIRQALLLLIGHWYANRETVNIGNISSSLPFATEALLSSYRVWSV